MAFNPNKQIGPGNMPDPPPAPPGYDPKKTVTKVGIQLSVTVALAALGFLVSDDFSSAMKENPQLVAWVPMIQAAATSLIDYLKHRQ